MSVNDSTPKQASLALLRQALKTGIRGKNLEAIKDCIEILEDDGRSELGELAYRRLKPGKILTDPRRPGFQMRATKSKRMFIYRHSWDGKQSELILGNYPRLSLSEAREKWLELRQGLLSGIKPTLHAAKPLCMNVEAMCDGYIALARNRKRSWEEDWRQLSVDVLPAWGDREANTITPEDAATLISRVYGRGARSGEKMLALMRSVYNVALGLGRGKDWHLSNGQFQAKPWFDMPGGNPFATIGVPERTAESTYLDEKGLASFLTNIRHTDMPEVYQDALSLQLLTVSRIGEVAGMSWGEVDLSAGVWTLPNWRAKNGREHRVMLSTQAIGLLKRRQAESDSRWVFPSPKNRDALRVDSTATQIARNREALGVSDAFTSHSLRHTSLTGLARLGAGREIRDRVSNHAVNEKSDMDSRYNRHQLDSEAQEWLQKWADYLENLTEK